MNTTLNKLRLGDAFQFEENGPVFVKCRGGFRPGCGGQLHTCSPTQAVIKYRDTEGVSYDSKKSNKGE